MSSESFQPLQGMSDLDSPEIYTWQRIERIAHEVFALYSFSEVRTPILERTQVFTRSLGDTTDVVQKEMYTFEDRGARSISLRPEGTAGVVRYLSSQGQEAANARLYYIGPMFRAERPQAGRKRQFHQCGVEMVGEPNPLADAECIALQLHLLQAWGIEGCSLQLNTRGATDEMDGIADRFRGELEPQTESLCADCRRRIDQNVMRVLDCKNPACCAIADSLPKVTDLISDESRRYFESVVAALDALGVQPTLNPKLVRGLDYYNHTVWEITHPALGAQDALAGGGRYAISFGKQMVAGVGFAMGLERVGMALAAMNLGSEPPPKLRLWLISLGAAARTANFALMQELRGRGISCSMDLAGRSMKAQMRAANQANALSVLIRGEDELEQGVCLLKDMSTGNQSEISDEALLLELTDE